MDPKYTLGGLVGGLAGGLCGIAINSSLVGASGVVAGYSAAGITSGLAGMGGTMMGGIAVSGGVVVISVLAGVGLGILAVWAYKRWRASQTPPIALGNPPFPPQMQAIAAATV